MKYIMMMITSGVLLFGANIHELFNAVENRPLGVQERLKLESVEAKTESLEANFYPKLELFASLEHYTIPMNVVPLLPTDASAIGTGNGTYPFSEDLQKVGVNFSLLLFAKELYTLHDSMKELELSAKESAKLGTIANQALIVGANGTLIYLESLQEFLDAKKESLSQTQKSVRVGIESGRVAMAEGLKLENKIAQIDVALQTLQAQKKRQINSIESLTGIRVKKAAPMKFKEGVPEGSSDAGAKPLKYFAHVAKNSLKSAKESYFPKVMLQASYLKGFGESYNNSERFDRDVGFVGIKIVMPLYDRNVGAKESEKRVAYAQAKNLYAKQLYELKALESSTLSELDALEASKVYLQKSIDNSKQLRLIAKMSYSEGRMNMEEYLRYEEEYAGALTAFAELKLREWQLLSKLSVVYGIDLKEMVE